MKIKLDNPCLVSLATQPYGRHSTFITEKLSRLPRTISVKMTIQWTEFETKYEADFVASKVEFDTDLSVGHL